MNVAIKLLYVKKENSSNIVISHKEWSVEKPKDEDLIIYDLLLPQKLAFKFLDLNVEFFLPLDNIYKF